MKTVIEMAREAGLYPQFEEPTYFGQDWSLAGHGKDFERFAALARADEREATTTKANQWQPIETAPRDGSNILLANKAGVAEGGWLTDIDHGADWEGQIGAAGFWRADGTDWPDTHWQPLPLPPTQGGNEL